MKLNETDLVTLAKEAKKYHGMADTALWSSVEHRIKAGEYLTQAKAMLKGDGWVTWCPDNVGISSKIANAYIALFKSRKAIATAQAKIHEEMSGQALSVMQAYAIAGAKVRKSKKQDSDSHAHDTKCEDDAPEMPAVPVIDDDNAKLTFNKSTLRNQLAWLIGNSDWLAEKKVVTIEVIEDLTISAA